MLRRSRSVLGCVPESPSLFHEAVDLLTHFSSILVASEETSLQFIWRFTSLLHYKKNTFFFFLACLVTLLEEPEALLPLLPKQLIKQALK